MSTKIVEFIHPFVKKVIVLIILKLESLMLEKGINTKQLSEMTGIRWNTIDDLAKNKAKHWSPESLDKIMKALCLEHIAELIEYERG